MDSSTSLLVDSVKESVRNPSKCTTDTVTQIRQLLSGSRLEHHDEPCKTSHSEQRRGGRNTSRTTKAGAPAKLPVYQSAGCGNGRTVLSKQERLTLATELFNNASKSLSCYSIPQVPISQASEAKQNPEDTKKTPPKSPLQPMSPNRKIVRSPEKAKPSPEYSHRTNAQYDELPLIAECARLSLSSLRVLRSDGANSGAVNAQLEQASSILVGKFISAGLYDAATQELREQKRRIRTDNGREGTKRERRGDHPEDPLEELLQISGRDLGGNVLQLLVSFQSHVLRLIVAERKPSTVNKLPDKLSTSNSSSPVNVILAAYHRGIISKEKTIQHLQSLSHILLSLAATPSGSTETKHSSSKLRVKPLVALILQFVSLEIRCMSSKVSRLRYDEAKELWDPLARYIFAFMRRSPTLKEDDYRYLKETFNALESTVIEHGYKLSHSSQKSQSLSTTFRTLSQLSQGASQPGDAISYCQTAIKFLPDDQYLHFALCRCKIAHLIVQSISKGSIPRAASAVEEAADTLAVPLRGNQTDIEELLVESARLKKATMGIMTTLCNATFPDESRMVSFATFRSSTVKYLTNFVRLLTRYLGPSASQRGDGDETISNERLEKFGNIASAAIDSVVSMGKLAITTEHPTWAEVEPVLSDCLQISSLQNNENSLSEPAMPNTRSGFLKLSNLFWSLYVSQKEAGKTPEEQVQALERSVGILQRSPSMERPLGHIAIRWEKLAGLYSAMGQKSKSDAAYIKSLRSHLDSGVLKSTECDFAKRHHLHIWRDPQSPVFTLGRVLNTYVKTRIQLNSSETDIFYDDVKIGDEQRAIVLERQMSIIAGSSNSSDLESHFTSIVSSLLSLYPFEHYPVRRMRVILEALRFVIDNGNHADQSFRDNIIMEARECLADDVDLSADRYLAPFWDYTQSSLRLSLAFFTGKLSVDTLDDVIRSWVHMLQDCEGQGPLEDRVDDIPTWISQMRAAVDYLEMQGLWRLRIRVLCVIRRALECQSDQCPAAMVSCFSQLGAQYSRLGYSEPADNYLARAETLTRKHDISPIVLLAWRLAHAEHLLNVGRIDNCSEILHEAQSIFAENAEHFSKGPFQTRCEAERLIADGVSLLSRLSLAKEDLTLATYYAKSAVKLSSRIWARLDRYARKKQEKSSSPTAEQDVGTITSGIAAMDLSHSNAPMSENGYKGALFWPHFTSHYGTLMHLSRVASRNGLFQDSIYYGEQALEVGKSIGSTHAVALILSELGKFQILGCQVQKADGLFCTAGENSHALERHLDTLTVDINRSTMYRHSRELGKEREVFEAAYQVLVDISHDSFVGSLDPFDDVPMKEIVEEVKDLSIKAQTSSRPTRQVKAPRGKQGEQRASRPTKAPCRNPQPVIKRSMFSDLQRDLLLRQASAHLSSQDLHGTHNLLEKANEYSFIGLSGIDHVVLKSEYLLACAIQQLSSHAVYCVLRESTISLPSIQVGSTPTSEKPCTSNTRKTRATNSTRRAKATATQTSKTSSQNSNDEVISLLASAQDSLHDVSRSAALYGSTKDNHSVSFLLSRVSMLAHATTSGKGASPDLTIPAYSIELGRNTAFRREDAAINFDNQLSEPIAPLEWPAQPTIQTRSTTSQSSDPMKSYVDILPPNWQAISMTLSADRNEFIISRLRAGQAPFLLCLPLKRSDPENIDEEEFDFDNGKEELVEIIRLANETAHATEARFDKKSKKRWWANRETLDDRLRQLLHNIETVWFGGFRGVFAAKPRSEDLVSKFSDSLETILDKHLPSRQKSRKTKSERVTLDRNVIELFVNIGRLEDDSNPEDSVTDLLYFVVDILQFHGERNAYDEIDFDMMVVEVLDALRAYKDAQHRAQDPDRCDHTILILDRALHSFPWESLDCLQGSSVSRMPSLDCLREQILNSQDTRPSRDYESGFHIAGQSGSYILNPSGDLKSTQETFEGSLSALDSWTGIVRREPSEDEFKDALQNKDLFLYFGHGSGAQYIRGRTIKRLDRCAVTFLMGCSSGSMTEAGDFEPFGTPWNYMHAGSPSLVATLWDVTDKDIDRFAASVFQQWGLVDPPSPNSESPTETKSRNRKAASPTLPASSEPVSLDTAVAKSRSSCILRYLNAAAPVVYGIPVFLK